MPPAVDAVALAASARQACPACTDALPAAGSDFLALLVAALTADPTSAPVSGTQTVEPTGEVTPGPVSATPAVEPSLEDTPSDAAAPAHAAPEMIDPSLATNAVPSGPATEGVTPINVSAETTQPPSLAPQHGKGSPPTTRDTDMTVTPGAAPMVASPSSPEGAAAPPAVPSPGAVSTPAIRSVDEAAAADPEPGRAGLRGAAAAPVSETAGPADGEAALSQPIVRRRVDLLPCAERITERLPHRSEGSAPPLCDDTEPQAGSDVPRSASAPVAPQENDGTRPTEPVLVRTSISFPAELRLDAPSRPCVEAPVPFAPGPSASAEIPAASGPHPPASPLRGAPARTFIPVVRQLAPVLITLALSPQEGPVRLTLLLEPQELGRIEVAVERASEGRLAIAVIAERAETLQLLQRDHALLDRALAQAGVGSQGRSLSFAFGEPGGRAQSGRGDGRGPRTAEPERAMPAPAPRWSPTALLDIAV